MKLKKVPLYILIIERYKSSIFFIHFLTHERSFVMQNMDLEEAKKILGSGKELTIPHVLKCFEVKYWALNENNELDQKLDTLILSKQTLLRKCVEMEVKTRHFFKVAEQAPFKNICPACKGAGEIYKFARGLKVVKCRTCLGQKAAWVKCTDCKGTGMYQPTPESNPVPCRECRKYYDRETDPKKKEMIKGKILFKCDKCRGTGQIKVLIRTHEIESTTPCKRCNELGFIPPSRKKDHSQSKKHLTEATPNPVLSSEIASKIKESIDAPHPEEMIEPDSVPTETEKDQSD
jgi:DnaJ-class molecular chaperone